MDWRHFIGQVVRVRTAGGGGGAGGGSGEGGKGRGEDGCVCTGMLCAIEPASGHVMLLRLGPQDEVKERSGGTSGSSTSGSRGRGGGQHTVTLLHPQFIDAIEPLDPVPKAWLRVIASGAAARQMESTPVENTAAVRGGELAMDGGGDATVRGMSEADQEAKLLRPTLEDVVGLLQKNSVQFEVVPGVEQGGAVIGWGGRAAPGTILMFGGELEIRGPPYDASHCASTNAVILRRVRKLLSSLSYHAP
jgi:hypothetical protein